MLSIALLIVILALLPLATNIVLAFFIKPRDVSIAPLFTAQVQYWQDDIVRWSTANDIDPNLMATIMQIESCGHPTVVSNAGARGLFQVMPFHFDDGENMLDPDTNAQRSANFIRECTAFANGDVGLILGCYNGGPSVTQRPFHTWHRETQRYYVWGLGIYYDAVDFDSDSQTLTDWLNAGGQNLCSRAATAQQLR
ncbi:MAG: lytic transglycosylase domain-containing protein [Anaerolineae bacterium]|nr:lytic transglycosylase domain-containing protein [Anaerolineae bacterium]